MCVGKRGVAVKLIGGEGRKEGISEAGMDTVIYLAKRMTGRMDPLEPWSSSKR